MSLEWLAESFERSLEWLAERLGRSLEWLAEGLGRSLEWLAEGLGRSLERLAGSLRRSDSVARDCELRCRCCRQRRPAHFRRPLDAGQLKGH